MLRFSPSCPFQLDTQMYRFPSLTAAIWLLPDAIAVTAPGIQTRCGIAILYAVLLVPSTPYPLTPHVYTAPSIRAAACCPPSTTAVAGPGRSTSCGVCASEMTSEKPRPHQYMEPLTSTALRS